uniref:Uncharacterized protein n=1 Tax=Anguilla anguilla TaxID=7936 RepID=A0A0E9SSV1_ANGAN
MCVYVWRVCQLCLNRSSCVTARKPTFGSFITHNCLISHHSLLPSRGNPIHLVAFQNVMLFILMAGF